MSELAYTLTIYATERFGKSTKSRDFKQQKSAFTKMIHWFFYHVVFTLWFGKLPDCIDTFFKWFLIKVFIVI